MPWVPHGITNGRLTSHWPRRPDAYFDEFPAGISLQDHDADPAQVRDAQLACPTDAITTGPSGVALDRGRCILCGRCAEIAPELFHRRPGADVAALSRETLVVHQTRETGDALEALQQQLATRIRQLRHSVHIRHVDAGSDGSDEWEVQALTNPVYDAQRLGIFFTASPRHADILLVTGIGTSGMREPLLRTREAMPDPVVVIATGTDAVSGGLVGGGYTGGTGVGSVLDVDIWIPGSPATPFSILHGILLALGRIPASSERRAR